MKIVLLRCTTEPIMGSNFNCRDVVTAVHRDVAMLLYYCNGNAPLDSRKKEIIDAGPGTETMRWHCKVMKSQHCRAPCQEEIIAANPGTAR